MLFHCGLTAKGNWHSEATSSSEAMLAALDVLNRTCQNLFHRSMVQLNGYGFSYALRGRIVEKEDEMPFIFEEALCSMA